MQVVTKVIEMPKLGRGDPTVITGETAGKLEPGGSWETVSHSQVQK